MEGCMEFFLIILFYCYSIHEVKDMSSVKHAIAVKHLCVRCLIAMDDIFELRKIDKQQLEQTMLARK